MSEVKWIKLSTSTFDDEKIKLIEQMPDGDTMLVIWVKLLTLAGKTNESGFLWLSRDVPLNDEMLSTIFNRPLQIVRFALEVFRRYKMVEFDGEYISIANWEKHQNSDGLEKIREQTQQRVAKHREKKRLELKSANKQESKMFCSYCASEENITIDHMIAQSKNGSDELYNKVLACKSCNSSKKDKTLSEFLNDSFKYTWQGVNHDLVRSNPKIMSLVKWDGKRYKEKGNGNCNATVTHGNAIDIDKDIDINIPHEVAPQMDSPSYDDDFEKVWAIYPRKVEKKSAAKSFLVARKRHTLEAILLGVENYVAECKKENREQKYIKHASTFFNAETYMDYQSKKEETKPVSQELKPIGSQTNWGEDDEWTNSQESSIKNSSGSGLL